MPKIIPSSKNLASSCAACSSYSFITNISNEPIHSPAHLSKDSMRSKNINKSHQGMTIRVRLYDVLVVCVVQVGLSRWVVGDILNGDIVLTLTQFLFLNCRQTSYTHLISGADMDIVKLLQSLYATHTATMSCTSLSSDIDKHHKFSPPVVCIIIQCVIGR